jgi:hypothetical protein
VPSSLDHVLGDARLRDLEPELEQFSDQSSRPETSLAAPWTDQPRSFLLVPTPVRHRRIRKQFGLQQVENLHRAIDQELAWEDLLRVSGISRAVRSSSHDDEQQNMSDKPNDAYGYVPAPGEILIRSDEIACILVFRDERPIKIIYPDGRVDPFAGPDRPG